MSDENHDDIKVGDYVRWEHERRWIEGSVHKVDGGIVHVTVDRDATYHGGDVEYVLAVNCRRIPRADAAEAELGALRKRVGELMALNGAAALAVDALEGMQIETMLPSTWRALTDEQRLEMMATCCRGCGSLDTGCQCWNDE